MTQDVPKGNRKPSIPDPSAPAWQPRPQLEIGIAGPNCVWVREKQEPAAPPSGPGIPGPVFTGGRGTTIKG